MIIKARPNWHEGFDNPPSIEVLVDQFPDDSSIQWEERNGLYLGRSGALSRFFSWSGKPDQGFGGWKRSITMLDGSVREIIGGWHGSTKPFNTLYPAADTFIDASGTDNPTDFERGYTFISCGLRVESLVDWWLGTRPEWGLALVQRGNSLPLVEPMRDRSVKCYASSVNVIARLLPRDPKSNWNANDEANLRSYFLGYVDRQRLGRSVEAE